MAMALNKPFASHFLHPVHESESLMTEDFLQPLSSRLKRRRGHAATHHPHPVQRYESIFGRKSKRLVDMIPPQESTSTNHKECEKQGQEPRGGVVSGKAFIFKCRSPFHAQPGE